MSIELWAWVPGFEGKYEVSTEGRVRSLARKRRRSDGVVRSFGGHLMACGQCPRTGYLRVNFRDGRRQWTTYVHRVVAIAYMGEPLPGQEVAHIDGDPTNNRVENLRWCSHVENESHKVAHGRVNRGSRNGIARLTEDDVRSMRAMYARGARQVDVGAAFGVSTRHARAIVNGEVWKHVGMPTYMRRRVRPKRVAGIAKPLATIHDRCARADR